MPVTPEEMAAFAAEQNATPVFVPKDVPREAPDPPERYHGMFYVSPEAHERSQRNYELDHPTLNRLKQELTFTTPEGLARREAQKKGLSPEEIEAAATAAKAQSEARHAEMVAQQAADRVKGSEPAGKVPDYMKNAAGYVGGAADSADRGDDSGGGEQSLAVPQARYVGATHDRSRIPYSDTSINRQIANYGLHHDAIDELADAESRKAIATAGLLHQASQRDELDAAQMASDANAERAQVETQRRARDAAIDEMVANSKINPGRYMSSQGPMSRIVMAIGAGLGGYAQATGGGANPMLDMIQKNIDRDIAAQEQDLSSKKFKVNNMTNAIAEGMKAGMNLQQAKAAARIVALQGAQHQLEAQASLSDSDIVQARKKEMNAGLEDIKNKFRMDLEGMSYSPAHMVGGAAPSKKQDDLDKRFVPTGPNGEGFMARTEKEGEKGRALMMAKLNLVPKINRAIELYNKTNFAERGLGPTFSDDVSELGSLAGQIGAGLKEQKELGTWDNGSKELAQDIAGNLTSATGNPVPKLKSYLSDVYSGIDNLKKAQGGQSARQQQSVNKSGQIDTNAIGQPGFASPGKSGPMVGTKR